MYIALELHKCSLLLSSEIWNNWQSVREHRWQVLALLKGERRSLMYGYTVLQMENLSSQCVISITQLRLGNFIETIIVSCKKKQQKTKQSLAFLMRVIIFQCVGQPNHVKRKQKFLSTSPGHCKHTKGVSYQSSIRFTGNRVGVKSTIPIISLLTT